MTRAFRHHPLEAIGGTVFSLAAALSNRCDKQRTAHTALPIYGGALAAIGGLVLTRMATPQMLSLRRTPNDDSAALRRAFDAFAFWSYLRLLSQATAWLANLWSLAVSR